MLIQDDFGLQPLDNGSRMHLMDIIEDQYGKKSNTDYITIAGQRQV